MAGAPRRALVRAWLDGRHAVAGERALDGGGEEAREERVRAVRPGAELRVELRAANASQAGTSSSFCVFGFGLRADSRNLLTASAF